MTVRAQPHAIQEALPLYGLLDRYQRIETLSYVEGFLPVTRPEQVEAIGLESFPPAIGGAAKHLAEIALRQRTTTMKDPNRTVRRIVLNYVNYATDAHVSGKSLEELQAVITDDINPELILDRVVDIEQPGLLPLLRYFDLAVMRDTGRLYDIGYDPQKVPYVPENPGIMHFVEEAIGSWRVHQVRRLVLPQAQKHEANRFMFWTDRLSEVIKHYPLVRPIAQDGLDKLYGRAKEE